MKTINNQGRQGDLLLTRVSALPEPGKPYTRYIGDQAFPAVGPKELTPQAPEQNKFVLSHSETGHHHAVAVAPEEASLVQLFGTEDPLRAFFQTLKPVQVCHERSFDTHETITLPPGVYEVNRQREWVPETMTARRVAD